MKWLPRSSTGIAGDDQGLTVFWAPSVQQECNRSSESSHLQPGLIEIKSQRKTLTISLFLRYNRTVQYRTSPHTLKAEEHA